MLSVKAAVRYNMNSFDYLKKVLKYSYFSSSNFHRNIVELVNRMTFLFYFLLKNIFNEKLKSIFFIYDSSNMNNKIYYISF
jgi:hypothetical protein